jgi:hypothetical protein
VNGFKFRSLEQYDLCLKTVKNREDVEITVLKPGAGGLAERKIKVAVDDLVFTSAEM